MTDSSSDRRSTIANQSQIENHKSHMGTPVFAIVGAGLGGLTTAATLRRAGFEVQVYEQASRFTRIGAGIQMMPNSMKVLRRIGVEARVRDSSFEPYSHLNRRGDTGDVMRELPMPESLF